MSGHKERELYEREPQETWKQFFAAIGRAILLVFAVALFVGGASLLTGCNDFEAAQVTAAIEAETSERRALPPEEIAYWKRHARHQRECRGQTYVASCCDSSFDSYTVTCLNPKDIR